MPALTDPRAEAFAVARACGVDLEDAYELAGLAGGQEHTSRLAKQQKGAARIVDLIEAGRRQPITGQDIAFELQRMVQHFDDFDTPQRMRETRETLVELGKVQMELERERHIERERARRNSPPQARTSPKPPVSARISPPAERAAIPPAPRAAAPGLMGRIGRSASPPTPLSRPARGGSARTPTVLMVDPGPSVGAPSANGCGPGEVGGRARAA